MSENQRKLAVLRVALVREAAVSLTQESCAQNVKVPLKHEPNGLKLIKFIKEKRTEVQISGCGSFESVEALQIGGIEMLFIGCPVGSFRSSMKFGSK